MSLPTNIRKWASSQDGLENLSLSEIPLPAPGLNEVLVQIHAVALNYRDTEVVMGLYNHHASMSGPAADIVPCSDMCGTIIKSNSNLWHEGEKVLSIFNQTHLTGQIKQKDMASGLGLPLEGVLQEYRVFPEHGLVRKPAYLTDEEAATCPIAGLTAWMAINGMRQLGQPSGAAETILIQGTGGVAVSGLLIAKASGARVIITSSSDEKLEMARKLGADEGINYRLNPDWDKIVLEKTSGEGVDIIFENGGASTLRRSFECVAFGGLINCIGYLSGKEDGKGDRTNTNVLALKRNVTLKGILNGPKDRLEEMLRFYEDKKIRPVVDKIFPFVDAKEALKYLFKGGHFGKVVIIIK